MHLKSCTKHVLFMLFVALTCLGARQAVTGAEETVTDGVTYREIIDTDIPRAIQVLEIERRNNGLHFAAALGRDRILGIEPLDSLTARIMPPDSSLIAAVNADFYILAEGPFRGDPTGLCVVDGEMVSSPCGRSALAVLDDGSLLIERFDFTGTARLKDGTAFPLDGINQGCPDSGLVLLNDRFHTETRIQEGATILVSEPVEGLITPSCSIKFIVGEKRDGTTAVPLEGNRLVLIGRGTGRAFLDAIEPGETIECSIGINPLPGAIAFAVGGTPRLIRDGEISIEAKSERVGQAFVDTRHPRTAVGFNGEKVFLVTVDGRREEWSAGMDLRELATFMLELGATEALNLDGGGSTTMWVRNEVRNRPSDNRIRPIANTLLLYGPGR